MNTCRTRIRHSLLAVVLLVAPIAAAQGPGRAAIGGTVKDNSGAALPGVTVSVVRSGDAAASPEIAVTGMTGEFSVAGVTPGAYSVEAILDGFQSLSRQVKLLTDQRVSIAFTMAPSFGETVEVVAKAGRTGEVEVLETRRQAAVVSDSISAEEIRRTPDSSAASVVERLTGVTLIGDKYVFVRGLGERYSGTTMNGATLPTTETDKRVVPLDLFPAKLLSTVNVVKTYTPDRSGDFGSGIVEMTTTDFPSSATMKLSFGAGHQSGATGGEFRRYAGGIDWLGNGGQAVSSSLPAEFLQRRSSLSPSGFTPGELEQFGETFIGDWSGRAVSSADPATDYAVTYGNTFGPLGVVLSAVSNHKYSSTDEELRFFGLDAGNVLVPRNDYAMHSDRESNSSGVIGNLSLRLTDSNRIYLNSMLTRDASSEYRAQEGLNTNAGGFIRADRVRYQIEEIFSTRIRGEHNFAGPGIGSLAEWNLARSSATNESDLRETLYREGNAGVFALQVGLTGTNFYDLEDGIEQGGAAYSFFYAAADGTRSGMVKGGVDRFHRTRDFASRSFRWSVANQSLFDLTQRPEDIFTRENIRPDGLELREVTGVNDAYDAEHTIDAAYLMSDATFGRWRLIGGARYESSDQWVATFNPFDTRSVVRSVNESASVLPSMNLIYQAGSRTNVRLGYGRSVNRPEFRELSPFNFVEITGGRSVAGNPDLKDATLDSFDVRWETFPAGGEVMAVSLFYKQIDRPIERVIQPTTEQRISFVNAESADLWGAEVEYRRSLGIFTPRLDRFSLNLNYAWVRSDVTVSRAQVGVVTSLERPLEGQSDQVANAALQYYDPLRGTMVRLLTSYVGARLADVGAYGQPDIYEAAYTSIDAVISQRMLLEGLEVKLAATNLLGGAREFTQGSEIQRLYRPGRTISLSLSYAPF
ncbi:MAG TPA: outer membrane beta-barrel protein [Thermoanaerobaculia bacterium]|nr:outer membrane beta-barrel protein [Thermoanaerobaculia bacterium]